MLQNLHFIRLEATFDLLTRDACALLDSSERRENKCFIAWNEHSTSWILS